MLVLADIEADPCTHDWKLVYDRPYEMSPESFFLTLDGRIAEGNDTFVPYTE
jgi:hypothetical protein